MLGGLVDFHQLFKSAVHSGVAKPVARREKFPEIAPEVDRLLLSDQWSAVTITIKYTDDGFSIGATSDQQLQWSFFPKAKLESEREEKMRTIFRELRVAPTQDYLADAGRTRVLEYELPRDQSMTVSLCSRLLREIYEMREEDELCFHFHPKES